MALIDDIARAAGDPQFVANNVTRMRAPLREKTIFGPAGKAIVHGKGERIIYGPNGAPLCKVVEDELHGCQIEEDERLHAVVRPSTYTSSARTERA
jgi:hypothetical protein